MLVNGNLYAWGQITILVGNNPLVFISSISFRKNTKKDNHYGIGDEPVGRGRGNKEYSGSIDLYMEDIKRLIDGSPDSSLDSIQPFSIKVLYGNPLAPTVDILSNVEFTEDGQDLKQGDTKFTKNIPFIFAGLSR